MWNERKSEDEDGGEEIIAELSENFRGIGVAHRRLLTSEN